VGLVLYQTTKKAFWEEEQTFDTDSQLSKKCLFKCSGGDVKRIPKQHINYNKQISYNKLF
jgi:hypothetical protein